MRVRAFESIGDRQPMVKEASVVLVEDDAGTPLSVACEYAGGHLTCHAGDPEFVRVLRALGFNQLVIVNDLAKKLKDPEQLPVLCGRN